MTFKAPQQPEPEYAYLVVQLAALRQRKKIPLSVLNDIAGFHNGYIEKLECGERNASVLTLCLWARSLGAHITIIEEKIPSLLPPIGAGYVTGRLATTAKFRRLARSKPKPKSKHRAVR